MVKIYRQPFAHEGDTIAIPDASQPDGKMSSSDGWTPDYQLPKTDPNYKPVGRQEMNGVFKEVTESLGQVQVQGAATWSADGAPYPANAQVYHNGKQWLALRANSVSPTEGWDWSAIGAAATRDVGTAAGNVMEVGAFGLQPRPPQTVNHMSASLSVWRDNGGEDVYNRPSGYSYGSGISIPYSSSENASLSFSLNGRIFYSTSVSEVITSTELYHTGNMPATATRWPSTSEVTGLPAELATKANTSTQVIAGTGLSGGGNLGASRTLNVSYGTTAGTAAQGNDSRIVNAVPNSRTISAGTGLTGGGDLTDNHTLSIAASHIPLGVGQTWQDVTGSRSKGASYTNTTGRSIVVSVVCQSDKGNPSSEIYVNGVRVGFLSDVDDTSDSQLTAIIPSSATYQVSTSGNIILFAELR